MKYKRPVVEDIFLLTPEYQIDFNITNFALSLKYFIICRAFSIVRKKVKVIKDELDISESHTCWSHGAFNKYFHISSIPLS